MDVRHEPERQRFIVRMDGVESVLDYRLENNTVNFTHTFVPVSLRGRGVAERLVRTGIAWARAQGYAMQASCWYARRFLDRGRTGV